MTPVEFLPAAVQAARAAGHIFPEHAACEAALESGWGGSELTREANNLFGQKQSHPPQGGTLSLPTREYLHGAWVTVTAQWKRFADWQASFAARMVLLRELEDAYPHYRAALSAATGEQFVEQVSLSWSTDPERAQKVMLVYRRHFPLAAIATGAPILATA